MLEDGLQLFQLQGWGDAEHAAITIKTAVGHQNVTVWIESEKVAEGLDSDDGAGDGIVLGELHPGEKPSGIPRRSGSDRQEASDHTESNGGGFSGC